MRPLFIRVGMEQGQADRTIPQEHGEDAVFTRRLCQKAKAGGKGLKIEISGLVYPLLLLDLVLATPLILMGGRGLDSYAASWSETP